MDNSIKNEYWDKKYWDNYYKSINFRIAPKNYPIRKLIEKYIRKQNGDCIEIGCYPGQFLAIFGELGYTLHGIDLSTGVDTILPNWLKNNGYKIGYFYKQDFTAYTTFQKYDIVCSFGFIEHFPDWWFVIKKHMQLVNRGGYIIITAPNFKGFIQYFLHKIFDNANLQRHVIDSMNPEKWKEILQIENYEIIYCGYFGGFLFWIDNSDNDFIKKIIGIICESFKYIGFILPNSRLYSPFCGIIARKK